MSQKDVPDWFSFYVYEFMSDERVVAMTLEQVGAYVLLMLGQWINGSIPSDIPALARLLKRTTAEMEILWAGVGPCFTPHPTEPGRLIQARLEQERAETLSRMEKSREKERLRRERARNVRARVDTNAARTEHVSEPCTVLSLICSKDSKRVESDAKWSEFKSLYPAHKFDEERAAQAWIGRDGEEDAILDGLRAWVASPQWAEAGGRWVNLASKFIFEGVYKLRPTGAASSPPSAVADTMDPETRRRLEERKRNG